jgi:hypothetical protein
MNIRIAEILFGWLLIILRTKSGKALLVKITNIGI